MKLNEVKWRWMKHDRKMFLDEVKGREMKVDKVR